MARYIRKGIHLTLALLFAVLSQYELLFGIPVEQVFTVATLGLFAVFLAARYLHLFDRLRTVHARSAGDLYFTLGIFTCTLLFLPEYAHAFFGAMAVLGFADAGASLAGGVRGTHEYRISGERRTWEGSGVACLVSALVLWIFGMPVFYACSGGVLLALCEALATRGSDNFFLPVLAGALLAIV